MGPPSLLVNVALVDVFINNFEGMILYENEGMYEPHSSRVPVHHVKICANDLREVCLVDHKEIGLSYSGTTLTGDFVAPGDINLPERILLVAFNWCWEGIHCEI